MKTKYPDIHDGEPVTLNPQKSKYCYACCDCGLVHDVEYIVGHRQKLTFRVWRNKRKTAALRREDKKRTRRG